MASVALMPRLVYTFFQTRLVLNNRYLFPSSHFANHPSRAMTCCAARLDEVSHEVSNMCSGHCMFALHSQIMQQKQGRPSYSLTGAFELPFPATRNISNMTGFCSGRHLQHIAPTTHALWQYTSSTEFITTLQTTVFLLVQH
jgi:hypothetical protein